MAKTRKIQVTLDEAQYEQLAEIARREDKKLARVVREAIVRYCIEPAAARRKQEALEGLLAIEPTPVPDDYATWEAEYTEAKGTGGVTAVEASGEDNGVE